MPDPVFKNPLEELARKFHHPGICEACWAAIPGRCPLFRAALDGVRAGVELARDAVAELNPFDDAVRDEFVMLDFVRAAIDDLLREGEEPPDAD